MIGCGALLVSPRRMNAPHLTCEDTPERGDRAAQDGRSSVGQGDRMGPERSWLYGPLTAFCGHLHPMR